MPSTGKTIRIEQAAMPRVTIYDVAERVGVSASTVSRVLNDSEAVADRTRRRVKRAVEKLGYVPNRTAKALAKQERPVLAVAAPSFITPFYNELMKGVRAALKDVDAELLLHDLGTGAPQEALAEFQRRGAVDGLLIISTRSNKTTVEQLKLYRTPTVLIGAEVKGFDSFYWDEVVGARAATLHLTRQGHQRIGMIRSSRELPFQELRLQGYQEALRKAGLSYDEALVCSGYTEKHVGFSEEAGYEAMGQLLETDPPVTAVFCSSDVHAMGAWKAIREADQSVPGDVALVGYGDVKISRFIGLSSVAQRMREVGERAAQRLFDRIQGAELGLSSVVSERVEPVLQVRRSSTEGGQA